MLNTTILHLSIFIFKTDINTLAPMYYCEKDGTKPADPKDKPPVYERPDERNKALNRTELKEIKKR